MVRLAHVGTCWYPQVSFSSIIAATTGYLLICILHHEDPSQFFSALDSTLSVLFCMFFGSQNGVSMGLSDWRRRHKTCFFNEMVVTPSSHLRGLAFCQGGQDGSWTQRTLIVAAMYCWREWKLGEPFGSKESWSGCASRILKFPKWSKKLYLFFYI